MNPSRQHSLQVLASEVGILIRRVKPIIGELATSVHPDLQPASYMMLTWLAERGPVRPTLMVETFGIDKGAVSRQLQHLVDLGLVDRSPDPADGRASVVNASATALERLSAIAHDRRELLDSRLSDWADDDLAAFVTALGRYNQALESDSNEAATRP